MREPSIEWVVLTMGNRPAELETAVASLGAARTLVVVNGAETVPATARTILLGENRGVPGGRDAGVKATAAEVVGFLDDDAELLGDQTTIVQAFADNSSLGAVAMKLIDERGETARRHVPRMAALDPDRSGDVALFLGGACAIRREAYEQAGGFFIDLFYGHEEVELCWRLVDAGWEIRYLADVEVFHPSTSIERHPDGWELTGRNRVLVARRSLPWPVALAHVLAWLALGIRRAPPGRCRRQYLAGWRAGWRLSVDRRPISWRAVMRLTRLGRPPVL